MSRIDKIESLTNEELQEEFYKMLNLFEWMCIHADEDCPTEYRTKHFKQTLFDATEYLETINNDGLEVTDLEEKTDE